MGGGKVLLPWRGRPLVVHIAEIALASRLSDMIIVTGDRADEVSAALHDLPVQLVYNPDYRAGLSTSLKAGIAAVPTHYDGALVMLADQPLLTTETIDRMLDSFAVSDAPIIAPFAAGQRGNPVLFERALFSEFEALTGDEGARRIIAAFRDRIGKVEVDPKMLEDIDTPEAFAALAAIQNVDMPKEI